jgi:heme A synthase
MTTLRRLSILSLLLGFGHVVFGAVVRITGSGLGCGDHWPKCHGYWFPPLERTDLIIEVSHRYFAAGLSLAILTLLVVALMKRRESGVSGRGGILRPAAAAAVLVVAAALFGAATVKYELANKWVIVVHLAIAMTLLAVLVAATLRAGALGGGIEPGAASSRTWRGARVALSLAFAVLILGALTAHLPGANSACQGFPLCRGSLLPTAPQQIQFVHRILAYALFFHLLGLMLGVRRRGEGAVVIRASRFAFGLAVAQVLVAAAMVEMHLPAFWRSLHQAMGTALWIGIVVFALLARRGSQGLAAAVGAPAPRPVLSASEAGVGAGV